MAISLREFLRPIDIQQQRLKNTIKKFSEWMYFPDDFEAVKILLGSVAANYLHEAPVWLMIVGPSGGGKSELCETLRFNDRMLYAGELTDAGLLSWGQVGKEQAPTGLMTDIAEFGFLVLPEFSSILSINHHKQKPLLSCLRQIYDGHLVRNIKTESGARLEWRGKCGAIMASSPAVDSYRHVIAEMGERFIYYRLDYDRDARRNIGRLVSSRNGQHMQMRKELCDTVKHVLEPVMLNPPAIILTQADQERIEDLSYFCSRCRSVVERNTSFNRDVEEVHLHEVGEGRLTAALAALFKGLIAIGVSQRQAWTLLDKVAWHSIPYSRARVLKLVLENTDPDSFTYYGGLRKVCDDLQKGNLDGRGVSPRSVTRALDDLVSQGVLEQQRGGKRGSRDLWKATEDTWMAYARVISDPPVGPEDGV